MHAIRQPHGHAHSDVTARAPFWVRHYDTISNVITLGRTKTFHRQTLALAEVQPGEAMLDVGCGTGRLLLEAERFVDDGLLFGLDVEPAMIEQAQRRAAAVNSRVRFEVGSIERLPFTDATFDVAFSTLMLHHLTDGQQTAGFVELVRVLKPGGRLVAVDLNPNRRTIITRLPGHSKLAQADPVQTELPARLRRVGFDQVTTGAHPSRQFSYAIARKVQQ